MFGAVTRICTTVMAWCSDVRAPQHRSRKTNEKYDDTRQTKSAHAVRHKIEFGKNTMYHTPCIQPRPEHKFHYLLFCINLFGAAIGGWLWYFDTHSTAIHNHLHTCSTECVPCIQPHNNKTLYIISFICFSQSLTDFISL